jgi:hypothetical protein
MKSNMPNTTSRFKPEEIKRKAIQAIVNFYRFDHELLTLDASERSVTHKLAEHLQREFPAWNVDCEYNRLGRDPKRLSLNFGVIEPYDKEAKTVFPDIIIHCRNTDENILIVELKKSPVRHSRNDETKLRAFTNQRGEYRYQLGLFLALGEVGCAEARIYRDGTKTNKDWKATIQTALRKIGYGG